MSSISTACLGVLAALLALPQGASGQDQVRGGAPPALAATAEAPPRSLPAPPAAPASVPGFGPPVALAVLDGARGGSQVTDARLNGTVSGNTAINVHTGSNVIESSSFANMTGIPIVIQNSGANVLIQNATVINLQFQ